MGLTSLSWCFFLVGLAFLCTGLADEGADEGVPVLDTIDLVALQVAQELALPPANAFGGAEVVEIKGLEVNLNNTVVLLQHILEYDEFDWREMEEVVAVSLADGGNVLSSRRLGSSDFLDLFRKWMRKKRVWKKLKKSLKKLNFLHETATTLEDFYELVFGDVDRENAQERAAVQLVLKGLSPCSRNSEGLACMIKDLRDNLAASAEKITALLIDRFKSLETRLQSAVKQATGQVTEHMVSIAKQAESKAFYDALVGLTNQMFTQVMGKPKLGVLAVSAIKAFEILDSLDLDKAGGGLKPSATLSLISIGINIFMSFTKKGSSFNEVVMEAFQQVFDMLQGLSEQIEEVHKSVVDLHRSVHYLHQDLFEVAADLLDSVGILFNKFYDQLRNDLVLNSEKIGREAFEFYAELSLGQRELEEKSRTHLAQLAKMEVRQQRFESYFMEILYRLRWGQFNSFVYLENKKPNEVTIEELSNVLRLGLEIARDEVPHRTHDAADIVALIREGEDLSQEEAQEIESVVSTALRTLLQDLGLHRDLTYLPYGIVKVAKSLTNLMRIHPLRMRELCAQSVDNDPFRDLEEYANQASQERASIVNRNVLLERVFEHLHDKVDRTVESVINGDSIADDEVGVQGPCKGLHLDEMAFCVVLHSTRKYNVFETLRLASMFARTLDNFENMNLESSPAEIGKQLVDSISLHELLCQRAESVTVRTFAVRKCDDPNSANAIEPCSFLKEAEDSGDVEAWIAKEFDRMRSPNNASRTHWQRLAAAHVLHIKEHYVNAAFSSDSRVRTCFTAEYEYSSKRTPGFTFYDDGVPEYMRKSDLSGFGRYGGDLWFFASWFKGNELGVLTDNELHRDVGLKVSIKSLKETFSTGATEVEKLFEVNVGLNYLILMIDYSVVKTGGVKKAYRRSGSGKPIELEACAPDLSTFTELEPYAFLNQKSLVDYLQETLHESPCLISIPTLRALRTQYDLVTDIAQGRTGLYAYHHMKIDPYLRSVNFHDYGHDPHGATRAPHQKQPVVSWEWFEWDARRVPVDKRRQWDAAFDYYYQDLDGDYRKKYDTSIVPQLAECGDASPNRRCVYKDDGWTREKTRFPYDDAERVVRGRWQAAEFWKELYHHKELDVSRAQFIRAENRFRVLPGQNYIWIFDNTWGKMRTRQIANAIVRMKGWRWFQFTEGPIRTDIDLLLSSSLTTSDPPSAVEDIAKTIQQCQELWRKAFVRRMVVNSYGKELMSAKGRLSLYIREAFPVSVVPYPNKLDFYDWVVAHPYRLADSLMQTWAAFNKSRAYVDSRKIVVDFVCREHALLEQASTPLWFSLEQLEKLDLPLENARVRSAMTELRVVHSELIEEIEDSCDFDEEVSMFLPCYAWNESKGMVVNGSVVQYCSGDSSLVATTCSEEALKEILTNQSEMVHFIQAGAWELFRKPLESTAEIMYVARRISFRLSSRKEYLRQALLSLPSVRELFVNQVHSILEEPYPFTNDEMQRMMRYLRGNNARPSMRRLQAKTGMESVSSLFQTIHRRKGSMQPMWPFDDSPAGVCRKYLGAVNNCTFAESESLSTLSEFNVFVEAAIIGYKRGEISIFGKPGLFRPTQNETDSFSVGGARIMPPVKMELLQQKLEVVRIGQSTSIASSAVVSFSLVALVSFVIQS